MNNIEIPIELLLEECVQYCDARSAISILSLNKTTLKWFRDNYEIYNERQWRTWDFEKDPEYDIIINKIEKYRKRHIKYYMRFGSGHDDEIFEKLYNSTLKRLNILANKYKLRNSGKSIPTSGRIKYYFALEKEDPEAFWWLKYEK